MNNVVEIREDEAPRSRFERSIETNSAIEILETAKPGDIKTYKELGERMGCDAQHGGRSNVRSALHYLERERNMVFSAVPNVGYRRLTDEEIVKGAPGDLARARRASRRAAARLTCVEFSKLPREQQISHQAHMALLAAIRSLSKANAAKKLEGKVSEAGRILPLNQTLEAFKK